MIRLQKYLADAGVASRRASEKLITEGRVTVDGEVALLGCTVTGEETILLDGEPVLPAEERVVIMLYKPRGVMCTSDDPEGRPTVQQYFKDLPYRLYNVGRLDLNSEGLLLMTNDGELSYKLTHPKFGAEKTYYVVVNGALTATEIAALTNGVDIGDGVTAPAKIENVRTTVRGDTSFLITIREGRNREIRRMAEAVGHKTLRLKRERFAGLSIGSLKAGEWRYLTRAELEGLFERLEK